MALERYETVSGKALEYETPRPEVAAFLARVRAAAEDPRVTEGDLISLIYGRDNPILDQTIFPARGAVTPETFRDPVYHVMTDLLDLKRIQAGTLDPQKAAAEYTMPVSEAAKRLGVTQSAIRTAISTHRLDARKQGGRHLLRPASVEAYRVTGQHVAPDEAAAAGAAVDGGAPLEVRLGSGEGVSFRVRSVDELEDSSKDGPVRSGVLRAWRRIGVLAGKGKDARFFELAPGGELKEIAFRGFYVRGPFQIRRAVVDPEAAGAAYHAFIAE